MWFVWAFYIKKKFFPSFRNFLTIFHRFFLYVLNFKIFKMVYLVKYFIKIYKTWWIVQKCVQTYKLVNYLEFSYSKEKRICIFLWSELWLELNCPLTIRLRVKFFYGFPPHMMQAPHFCMKLLLLNYLEFSYSKEKRKKKITEILDQKHSSIKDKIMEPNFCISSTCERQNLDQDLLSILGVKFCFRNLEIVFFVLHLKSSM